MRKSHAKGQCAGAASFSCPGAGARRYYRYFAWRIPSEKHPIARAGYTVHRLESLLNFAFSVGI
jgi:hypothetical protein